MREHTLTAWWRERRRGAPKIVPAIDISSLTITGGAIAPADLTRQMRFIAPDDGNEDDRTVMAVALPEPVGPGETSRSTSRLRRRSRAPSRAPAPSATTSSRPMVPEDRRARRGRHLELPSISCRHGVFLRFRRVRRAHDRAARVAAGGHRRRARAHRQSDGTTTHRYYQEDVHDFAWTTSPDFVERARAVRASRPAAGRHAADASARARVSGGAAFRNGTRAALRYYGEWFGAYPYGHLTIVDTPLAECHATAWNTRRCSRPARDG